VTGRDFAVMSKHKAWGVGAEPNPKIAKKRCAKVPHAELIFYHPSMFDMPENVKVFFHLVK
jgi:hypothetical protein